MGLKEMHGCLWRGFARTSYRNHKTVNYQYVVQELLTSYKAMWCNVSLKIHFLESHLDFSQKTNTVKDFTKTFWLWKSGTKVSGPQVCWLTIAGHWRGMYLKPITDQIHTPIHFRGKFLPVSLVHKLLFCTNTVLYIFETLPDRNILYTYLNSA